MLKEAGYATGCFGKWHLGDQPRFLPTGHGFDAYFRIPYSNDMWPLHSNAGRWKSGVCPLPVVRGEEVVDLGEDMDDQVQLCQRFTEEAVAFIRENRDRPFFVYLPHAFIHHPRGARDEFIEHWELSRSIQRKGPPMPRRAEDRGPSRIAITTAPGKKRRGISRGLSGGAMSGR